MKKIRINRAKWRTGKYAKNKTGNGPTLLINNDGYKCCLGFIAQQVSHCKVNELYSCGMPNELTFTVKNLSTKIENNRIINTDLTKYAVLINDNLETTPKQKEQKLKRLFKDVYELEFFGEYAKNE